MNAPTMDDIENLRVGDGNGFDPEMQSYLVKREGDWIVSVTPMIFTDRICLTHVDEYPHSYTAGWCYDKGGAALIAAAIWDPSTDREPVGYIKVACDAREKP